MGSIITLDLLQKTIHNLDVSTEEKRENVSQLVSQLKKSAVQSRSFELSIQENTKIVKQKIKNSDFLTSVLKGRQTVKSPEFEVVRREHQMETFQFDKEFDFSKLIPKPEMTLGPFPTEIGTDVYFDFIRYEEVTSVKMAGQTQPILYLSAKVRRLILKNTGFTEINIPKGSIWLNAKLLKATAPADSYLGLKIKSGKIKFRTSVKPTNGEIILNALNTFSLDLVLDNDREIGNDDQFGLDAQKAKLQFPDNLHFGFGRGKLSLGEVRDVDVELYGQSKSFQVTPTFQYNSQAKHLFLGLNSPRNDFKISDCKSPFFSIWGETKIQKSIWVFTTRTISGNQTIPVELNGYVQMEMQEGLLCKWKGLLELSEIKLNKPMFMMISGYYVLSDIIANFQHVSEKFNLWQTRGEPPYQETEEVFENEAQLDFGPYTTLYFINDAKGTEAVTAHTDVDLFVDKPLQADGETLSPKTTKTAYVKTAQKDKPTLTLLGIQPQKEEAEQQHQFVIENAFFTTSSYKAFLLKGNYDENNNLTNGELTFLFDLYRLIPSLPHPYTGRMNIFSRYGMDVYSDRFEDKLIVIGAIQSICKWETEDDFRDVSVDFKINQSLFNPDSKNVNNEETIDFRAKEKQNQQIDGNLFRGNEMFTLFDVSTNYDHLGISMSFRNRASMVESKTNNITEIGENVVTIDRMNLKAPMAFLNGMTLPHITWEPLINETERGEDINGNPLPDPKKGYLVQQNNSFPTIFTMYDGESININPKDYIDKFQKNLKPGQVLNTNSAKEGQIFFSLPNGKLSIAKIDRFDSGKQTMNNKHLEFIRPKFNFNSNELTGAIQYRISAFKPQNEFSPPMLKGLTTQLKNIVNDPGISLLSETVHQIFQNVYAIDPDNIIGVPVTHFDFSGYGGSTFSDWRRPLAKYASIAQAKFDVMRGRLGHEIIQAVSMIYPYGICTTRTITFFRRNNSVIYREDSGWVAQSDGLFNFDVQNEKDGLKLPSKMEIHPGLFKGVYTVKNIKEVAGDYIDIPYRLQAGDYYKPSPLEIKTFQNADNNNPNIQKDWVARFVGVTFDSDALVDNVEGFEKDLVTGKRFKGYLQVKPEGVPVPPRVMEEMLQRSGGSLGGNIDCIVNIAKSNQKLKSNFVDITASHQNDDEFNPVFIGTVRGSVQLPDDGSWSMVEVDNQGNVGNLSNDKNISVIRKGLRKQDADKLVIVNPAPESKIAFPDALLNQTIQKTYGILQNTETQKLLFRDPFVKINDTGNLHTAAKTLMADSFRLLNSKGPFPNIENAIEILNDNSILDVFPNSQGLKKIIDYRVPNDMTFPIVGSGDDAFKIYVQYKNEGSGDTLISYATDSLSGGDRWKNEMNNLSVHVDLGPFEKLMTITGDFQSGISMKASVEKGGGAQIKFNDALQKIYEILEFLDSVNMNKPVDAVKRGLQVVMSNSSDSWEYKFKADKEIPLVKFPFDPINYNSPTTPLKLDAFFKVGCYFNQPIVIPKTINQIKPSAGAFLELGADIRVMCVSVAAATIYAIGRAEVGLAADLNNPPTLYFKFGFGVELAVGLPVIGSVAVTYMVGIDMKFNSGLVEVGAFLYFRGRAEILGGIVTITIAIEAKGSISKVSNGPTNCVATCTFALDISIAFVVNLSFSETWKETRQIS